MLDFLAHREKVMLKRIIAALLIVFEAFGALVFSLPQTPRGQVLDYDAWELVWEDEFEGTTLDTTSWCSAGDGLRRGGYWDINKAFVQDGNLILRTEYEEDGRFGAGWYSGAIETRELKQWKYGYFECRCICPAGEGLWAAFWTFSHGVGSIDGSGRDGAEIDIFESPYYGYPNLLKRKAVSSTIHFDGYGEDHQSITLGSYKVPNLYTKYNTFGVEWNENECIFYVNGVETDRITGNAIPQVEEWLMLTVEVNGNHAIPGANKDGEVVDSDNGIITNNSDEMAPFDFIVDYVRVYKHK
ncbi:MAG TPA: glycoside hydrolase family 16 protein [Clostridia bacterium]|nr:glycoside hydrolase family 16 protein [Clostridia bacterium]